MKKSVFSMAAFLSALFVSGCTTSTVPHQQSPLDFGVVSSGDGQLFQSVSTFAWHELSGTAVVKDKQLAQNASQLYHALVEQQMLDKGYRLVSNPLEADVLMIVAIAQQSEITDTDIFAKTMLSTGILPVDKDGEAVEKGSLYVAAFSSHADLQDESVQPIWKALAQKPMDTDVDEKTQQLLAENLVNRMMATIPTLQP
ncbi:DUF4136 domain-containing protein [Vibrio amylolyticus]|uniref:hypothetical protein n=1 Tax=Vibrio amylolyticus TaxID=2847292 RepID=UPI00355075E7